MTDWLDAVDGATSLRHFDKDEVKINLRMEWILLRAGFQLELSSDGRLVGLCPFHEDTAPSFALFGDNYEKAGCWSCDFNTGDVFDLLARLHSTNFRGALQLGGQLLEELKLDVDWHPLAGTIAPKPKEDPAVLGEMARQAWEFFQLDSTAVKRLIHEKQQTDPGWFAVTPDFLNQVWYVGAFDEWKVMVPHLAQRPDEPAPLVRGLKTRTTRSKETHLYAKSGSDLSELYGAWLDRGWPEVILCEGESDAWCASAVLRDRMDVLALPAGASGAIKPVWLERFKNRHVIIAFDGDIAGRRAARRWYDKLKPVATAVRVASLPDGEDLAGTHDLVNVVNDAVFVPPLVGAVEVTDEVYVRLGPNGHTEVASWSLNAYRELEYENGSKAYEGRVLGKPVVLTATDCRADGAITDWSIANGVTWRGVKRDAQDILGLLGADGPFLARGKGTTKIGWHEGNFVWPEGRIGPDYWRWTEPLASVPHNNLKIQTGPWDRNVMQVMFNLHLPGVMSPILAWLAVAPLRSLFQTFPFLTVTGTSGSGKTTLMDAVLTAFGWKIGTTLTATTPHAVHAHMSATNGIPVWFDEFRYGARKDSLLTLEQSIRDAYNGSPSMKGGANDMNKQAITASVPTAPIIITGENAFSETSHIGRMIPINLPSRGRQPESLAQLRLLETAGFGHAYLTWLVTAYANGTLPSLVVTETDRVTTNLEILGVGWLLLDAFWRETTGESGLPAPDWSLIEHTIATSLATDPIAEALAWALYNGDFFNVGKVVWAEGADICVKVSDFVYETVHNGQYTLPGGLRAIERYLEDSWGAMVEIHPTFGKICRLPDAAQRLQQS